MRILVTGSSGHLGEGLARVLRGRGDHVVGLDLRDGRETTLVGSIVDPQVVGKAVEGVDAVLHTATLHKPHVATHASQEFIDTNITGTLRLLEASVDAGVGSFVITSTTSTFGRALVPGPGEPAAWITEDVAPQPKNIYGLTKVAAEGLCELFHRNASLPCLILRTSRFFPEEDDRREIRSAYEDENAKVNEFLYRRVDLQDAVDAHLLALERAREIGFGRYIISATTPFEPDDLQALRDDARGVVAKRFPEFAQLYDERGWKMFPSLDRVYVNEKARRELGWRPRFDFAHVLDRVRAGQPLASDLAREVGSKGYHDELFEEGPYPVE